MKKMLSLSVCIVVLMSLIITPIEALKGTEVWEEEGYMKSEVDVWLEWNRDYYPDPETYPNFDIQGAIKKETYTGMERDLMVFELSTTSSALREWRKLFGRSEKHTVDPNTGLDENGNWYGAFYDTSDLKDGEEVTDLALSMEYEDDSGIRSTTKPWLVTGPKRTIELKVNGEEENISVWDGAVEDFHLEYTLDGLNYRIEYWNYGERLSDPNGVLVGTQATIVNKLRSNGEYIMVRNFSYSSHAIEVNGVKVIEDGASAPGFETLSVIGILIVGILHRRLNKATGE